MQQEKLMSCRQAAAWLGTEFGLKRTHMTVWNWSNAGVGGVKLEVLALGGRIYTTEGALRRFLRNTTDAYARDRGCQVNVLQT